MIQIFLVIKFKYALFKYSLVHSVLLDFLTVCSEEEKSEIAVAFTPYIPSLASTKDGVRVSMIFFWNAIVKDRRVSTIINYKISYVYYYPR